MSSTAEFISVEANVPEEQKAVVIACVKKFNEQEGKTYYCSGVQQVQESEQHAHKSAKHVH